MVEKLKKEKYQILELIIIFILTLLFNLICNKLTNDEIWNYGFIYNISTGLIPYKDFNMIITPLYPILGALFLSVFGKNFLSYHIFNSIICTTIFYNMKKTVPKNYYIIYSIFLLFSSPNYNSLCILLLYILIQMEDKKSNDYLIGIVLGLTFLTKQNIGIYLCLPTLFIKNINKIIKRIIGYIIPNIILLLYLIYNNTLYKLIDYVFLGIESFTKENFLIDKISLILVITSSIYLTYQYLKKKDIKIMYLLCFQLLVFPIIDQYHTMITIIPTLGYLLNKINLNKKIIILSFIIFISTIFSLELYNIYKGYNVFPNITDEYKYRKLPCDTDKMIKEVSEYSNSVQEKLYIISSNAYLFKLEAKIKINKYDLLNNGNLGRTGQIKLIKGINNECSNQKCTFIIDTKELSKEEHIQYNKDIIKYIMKNYKITESIQGYLIYKNY